MKNLKRILLATTLFTTLGIKAQSNYTITYTHYYDVKSMEASKKTANWKLQAALYMVGDSVSIYRLSKTAKALKTKFDLSTTNAHHALVKPRKTNMHYEIMARPDSNYFVLVPDVSKPWEILRDTIIFNKITCIAATRENVIAWYAPSIPVPKGPSIYYGLPGLIVKLYDVEHAMLYEMNSISYTIPEIIYSKPVAYISLEKFRAQEHIRRSNFQKQSIGKKKTHWFWDD